MHLCIGRGASNAGGSPIGRTGGLRWSENAGMSSENYVGIIMAENLRFLGEGSSAQGKPHGDSLTRALVDPGVRDRTSVGKQTMLCGEKRCMDWRGARTANRHR